MGVVAGDPPGAEGFAQPSRGGDYFRRWLGRGRQLRARQTAARWLHQIGRAHMAPAIRTRWTMLGADVLAAHGTPLDFIRREDGRRLLGASRAMLPAHLAARCVCVVHVARAV